jgi:hypothetical protein
MMNGGSFRLGYDPRRKKTLFKRGFDPRRNTVKGTFKHNNDDRRNTYRDSLGRFC